MITPFILEQWLEYPHWFWLILGGLLLTIELLGTAGYLLWLGLSAVLIGMISWLWPVGWSWLWGGFCLLSLVSVLLWHRWQQHCTTARACIRTQPQLNQPQQQLIGYRAVLATPLVNGVGRLCIGDGSWRIQANQPLMAGTTIVVVALEGITLRVEPAEEPL